MTNVIFTFKGASEILKDLAENENYIGHWFYFLTYLVVNKIM